MGIHELFEAYGVKKKELEDVFKAFDVQKYQPGEVVFDEGDTPRKIFFIKSGQAMVTRGTPGAEQEPLSVLNEGQFFGEIGLMENIKRTATVKALGHMELLILAKEEFFELQKSSPPFAALIKDISIKRLLKQISLFKELDEVNLNELQKLLKEKTYGPKELIFKENDPPDAIYIIVKGTVRIYRSSDYGKEINLAYLSGGDFFGELGLIESTPRSASVITDGECKMFVMQNTDFQNLLKENAKISFNTLKVLSSRMRDTNREMSLTKSVSFFKGMTILARPEKCLSCKTCELACAVAKSRTQKLYDAVAEEPLPVKRIHVRKVQGGEGAEPIIRPEHCTHCKDAPCLTSCKFKAIKRDMGTRTIEIILDKCVGCSLCARACPFNVISIIRTQGKKRVALKCTYCSEHQGGPACVRSCPTNTLVIALPAMTEL
ncbi:MAG: cyclic nucleotide-binding domain-containing protein [bacterium]|nr:cyclic nucleotide-binding domain-containing protein [bacterium]